MDGVQERPLAVVTGGSSGMGGYLTTALVAQGWDVVSGSRSAPVAPHPSGRVEHRRLDLADLRSVERFAASLVEDSAPGGRLAAVVANAGLQLASGATTTAQGFETTYGVNQLGHLHLLDLLLPHLVAGARVAIVSSGTHDPAAPKALAFPPPYDWTPAELARPARGDLAGEGAGDALVDGRRRYAASKVANIHTAAHLRTLAAARGHDVRVLAYDPGMMPGRSSALARDYPLPMRLGWNYVLPALRPFKRATTSTPAVSGRRLAGLIDAPPADEALYWTHGGRHGPAVPALPSAEAMDPDRAAATWDQGLDLIRAALTREP